MCELPRWGLTTVLRPRPWAHRGAVKTAVLGSFFQLVTLVAVINHPLQMTSRAAPHHSEGSLSAARSARSSFLDGMDCPHVKIARLELWAGVSSALGSRTSACAQLLAYFVHEVVL